MQNRVGACADRHIHAFRVFQRSLREDIAGAYVICEQAHDGFARAFGKRDPRRVYGGDGTVSGQRHAQRFQKAVHGICREHAGTRPAGGAGGAFEFVQFVFADLAGGIRAHRFEHGREGKLSARSSSCEHRAARNERAGKIEPDRAEQHAGDDLVAVSHEHAGVERMRPRENFRAVRNNFAGGEGIAHAAVSHGDAVAYADGRNDHGLSARRKHAVGNGARDFAEVNMSGNDFALRGNDPHDRLVHFAVRPAERAQKRSLRRHVASVRKRIRHNSVSSDPRLRLLSKGSDLFFIVRRIFDARPAARDRRDACAEHGLRQIQPGKHVIVPLHD